LPTLALPLREALKIDAAAPIGGGCIHECFRVEIAGKAFFLKCNSKEQASNFAAEADGLAALKQAGLRAPHPISHGSAGANAYLMLELLDLKDQGDFAALGRMLAEAHRKPGARFGWSRDNYIGATSQFNGWCDDWAEFWRTRRLQPQFDLARKRGYDIGQVDLSPLLENHEPHPSLLHGDLWSGNAAFTKEGPVVFDPAVYYGDREADLAMTELFGGFPGEFYRAYQAAYPLDAGYQLRKHLYNLYHLLNHLNLFGAGYLGQVKQTLGLLRRSL
jgi:fructosamine-3-kinase